MRTDGDFSAAPLGDQATNTLTRYPTQSHYSQTEPTSRCPILKMLSTSLGRGEYQFNTSLVWLDHALEHTIPRTREPVLQKAEKIFVQLEN